MWLLFCGGLGLSEEDVVNAEIHEKTQALIYDYKDICRLRSFQENLSAMYAYEFQVPEISIAKIEGLLSYYGFRNDDLIKFFQEHSTLDRSTRLGRPKV